MSVCGGVAGFVLVGGQSRRMGRDKALLADGSGPLVEKVALEVRKAAGSVALLGDPARYGHLGLAVIPDVIAGCGPMSGLHSALSSTETEWILIVACDLPNVDAEFLKRLLNEARPGVRCIAAQTAAGLEPLCAVYHRNTRIEVEEALREGRLRMRDLLAQLGAIGVEADSRLVRNVNTEEDWRLHLTEKERLH